MHQLYIILELKSSLRVALALDKVHNQGVLDRKHGVIGQVLVLAVKDLGSKRAVAFISGLGDRSAFSIHILSYFSG